MGAVIWHPLPRAVAPKIRILVGAGAAEPASAKFRNRVVHRHTRLKSEAKSAHLIVIFSGGGGAAMNDDMVIEM